MLQQVQDAVAAVLGRADTDPQQPLMEAGLDSLSAVELRNSLEAKLGVELPTTLVFDYPTMASLAGFLASTVQPGAVQQVEGDSGSPSDSETTAVPTAPARRGGRGAPSRRVKRTVAALSGQERQDMMLQQVQDAVAAVLGRADTDPQQPLMEAGLDSLSSVELRNSLEAKLGVELPTTLVFDYPTIATMAGFLANTVQPSASELPASHGSSSEADEYSSQASFSSEEEAASDPRWLVPAKRSSSRVVAVTGIVARAPANALSGIQPLDAVQMVPAGRWDLETHSG
jgi:acyl carrier protein